MALPPTAAPPMPMGADAGAAPPGMDMPPGGDDTGGEDQGEVIATIVKMPDGTFQLFAGDEPDTDDMGAGAGMPPGGAGEPAGGDEAAPEPQTFDSGPALLKGVMALIEGDKGAEKSFGDAFASKKGGGMGSMPPAATGM